MIVSLNKIIVLFTFYILTGFGFLIVFFYVQLVLKYAYNWHKIPQQFTNKYALDTLSISIIITARNEEKNIITCINSLINQNYDKTKFEIILVDDFSDDKTIGLASLLPSIKILQLSQYLSAEYRFKANKKRAIQWAVGQAKYPIIITVDADTYYPRFWLKAMSQYYELTQSKLITAPLLYSKKEHFFFPFLQLDLIALMGITAASIQQNKPTMVNGANMLFEKETFQTLKAFADNEHIASGDDTFLMQKIHQTHQNAIHYLKNTDAIATTQAPNSLSEFVNQRIRWTSKSSRNAPFYVVFTLFMNYIFYAFLLITFLFSIFNIAYIAIPIVLFTFKCVVDFLFFKQLTHFFNQQKLLYLHIWIEILHIPYILLLGVLSLLGKYTWKGRKV